MVAKVRQIYLDEKKEKNQNIYKQKKLATPKRLLLDMQAGNPTEHNRN